MIRKFALAVFAPVLLVMLSGCPAPSANPVSDPLKAQADPRLPGVWHSKTKDGDLDVYLHIQSSEGAWMDIVEVMHD